MKLSKILNNINYVGKLKDREITYITHDSRKVKPGTLFIAISGEKFIEAHSQFNDMVEAFALRVGCSSMELWGRKGWKKMLPDWKDSYIVFTKDLKERMH